MDVAKVIRTLGYIVYVALWSPVILLIAMFLPIWAMAICIQSDLPVSSGLIWIGQALKASIAHDMNFLKTGIW